MTMSRDKTPVFADEFDTDAAQLEPAECEPNDAPSALSQLSEWAEAKAHPKKLFILDTNVLLSDSQALLSFGDNDVVLPFKVIEELDRHKDRMDETGKNAREAARKLSEFTKQATGSLSDGLSLGTGRGTLKVMSAQDLPTTVDLPAEISEAGSGDNTILRFAMSMAASFPEETVVLVTRDVLLQLKSKAVGVTCEDYKKFHVATDTSRLYSGVKVLKNVDVDEFFADKEGFRLPEEVSRELMPNQFLVMKDNATPPKSALVRFLDKKKPLREIDKWVPGKLTPRNKEQQFVIDLLHDKSVKLVSLAGLPGSGKTLLAIACGLEQVMTEKAYKTLVVCRPIMPMGKDVGFLPGTLAEKMEPWVAPIKDNLRFLLAQASGGKKAKGTEDSMKMLFEMGIIEVEAMTFIRGRSIANAFILIDEVQNITQHEIKTILTRAGEGSKIVLTGDLDQIDNMYLDSVSNGLAVVTEKFKEHPIAGHVTLIKGERSELANVASALLT
jgi:PhoH-like ATPase